MLVAIIDTGIQPNIFPTGPIIHDLEVTDIGRIRERRTNIHSFHGAYVAAVLEKYAKGTPICSIKICDDETQTAPCSSLCTALRWCFNSDIPIINISMGSVRTKDFWRIKSLINPLVYHKQFVVAAYNNNGMDTMPAGHINVIGVKTKPDLLNDEYIVDYDSKKHDFIASSHHTINFLWGDSVSTSTTTSLAAPTITAAIVNGKLTIDWM